MQMQPGQMQPAHWQPLGGGPEEPRHGFQFFPIQVGGPTPYARSRRYLFIGISVYQFLMAIMALIEFQNYLSGILMILGCLVAWWGFKEDMNITYICWWGVLSLAGFIAGVVFACIGFAVKLSSILVKFNIPLACFFGMVLAWWLYTDYQVQHPASTDMVATWLRTYGLMRRKAPQAAPSQPGSGATLLNKGQFPQFNGTGQVDYITGNTNKALTQAGYYGAAYSAMGQENYAAAQAQAGSYGAAYGAMGQESYAAAQAQAGSYGAAYGAMGQENFATAQAKAEEGGFASFGTPAPAQHFATAPVASSLLSGASLQGGANLKFDPFMTKA